MAKLTIQPDENFNFSAIQNTIEVADSLSLEIKTCNLNTKHKDTLDKVAIFKYHPTISNKCYVESVDGGRKFMELYPEIKDIEFNVVPEYLPTELYLA